MAKKFGTFQGVFVPSSEGILGTVLFLILPAMVLDVGLFPMLLIILVAHSVTIATAFSLSDCATNLNKIGGGGIYALTKFSLGDALGGSIGVQLYLAQAASIGFYCIGFAEPLHFLIAPLLDFIPLFTQVTPEAVLMQKQILATVFLLFFFVIVMFGADFTLKLQLIIFVILVASILTIFISPLLNIDFNDVPLFTNGISKTGKRALTLGLFFTAFTRFFPAVTGISAGIGMSGDLKNPKKSIVGGTFSAILITMVIYLVATTIFSTMNPNQVISGYSGDNAPIGPLLNNLLGYGKPFPYNIPGVLILMGVLFATCSSALSVFMTGPRTLQFIVKDGLLPKWMKFLERDFKSGGTEPRFAIILSFLIGLVIIWMGSINFASMVVGILFLAVYGWVNGAAFLERFSKNPSFRPTFKSHWSISLYGFLACLGTICLFRWYIGIAIFVVQYVIFKLILKYKSNNKLEGVWWGVFYRIATASVSRLGNLAISSKNWRPVLISFALIDEKKDWNAIVTLNENIASFQGLINFNILRIKKKGNSPNDLLEVSDHDIPSSASIIESTQPTESILTLLQGDNLGKVKNNTLLMATSDRIDMIRILNTALSLKKNILLLKRGSFISESQNLDIWWRGEKNGNLMVLLAHIINRSLRERKQPIYRIRIIRKLDDKMTLSEAQADLEGLIHQARLEGEVIILPPSDNDFSSTLKSVSGGASLVMMGLPGNYTETGNAGLFRFKINEFLFKRQFKDYEGLSTILFVKSAGTIDVME